MNDEKTPDAAIEALVGAVNGTSMTLRLLTRAANWTAGHAFYFQKRKFMEWEASVEEAKANGGPIPDGDNVVGKTIFPDGMEIPGVQMVHSQYELMRLITQAAQHTSIAHWQVWAALMVELKDKGIIETLPSIPGSDISKDQINGAVTLDVGGSCTGTPPPGGTGGGGGW